MFVFFAGAAAVIAALGLIYWRWSRRVADEIAEGASLEWSRLEAHDPELIAGIDRTRFDSIYRRVHFPRFPGYALACAAAFLATLPLTFALLAAGLIAAQWFGWVPEPAEFAEAWLIEGDRMRFISAAPSDVAFYYARDIGGFYYFFGVLFVWLAIVAAFTHRFHSRRPGYLRDEILRER